MILVTKIDIYQIFLKGNFRHEIVILISFFIDRLLLLLW
jgi:hypothetical protein